MPTPDFAVGVAEISTTTGTGAYALGGALPGASTLASRITDGGTVNYRATDGARQEVGQGVFDAETNTLSRATITYPASAVDWGIGRRLISVEPGDNLSIYSPVTSVAGRTGNVVLSSDDLGDFDLSGAADGELIGFNGTDWVPTDPPSAAGIVANAGIWSIDATYPAVGTVVQHGAAFFVNLEPITGAAGAPVPAIDGAVTNTGTGTTIDVTLITAKPEEFVVVAVASFSPSSSAVDISGVTSDNLTFSNRVAKTSGSVSSVFTNLEIWTAKASDVLVGEVITVTAASSVPMRVMAFGISGIDINATVFDANSSLPVTAAGANSTPSLSGLSTTAANTVLLFFNAQYNNVFGDYTTTPPTGFTLIADSHDNTGGTGTGIEAFFETVSAAQASASISLATGTNSHNWAVVGDAILTLAAANVTPAEDDRWVKIADVNSRAFDALLGSTTGTVAYRDVDGWTAHALGTLASGAFTLVSTLTATGSSSTLSWTGLSGIYLLILNGLVPASNEAISLRFGTGSVPTWQTSGYRRAQIAFASNDSLGTGVSNGSESATGLVLSPLVASNVLGGGSGLSGVFLITACRVNGTAIMEGTSHDGSAAIGGRLTGTSAFTGIRILTGGGSALSSGSASLYEILT